MILKVLDFPGLFFMKIKGKIVVLLINIKEHLVIIYIVKKARKIVKRRDNENKIKKNYWDAYIIYGSR